MKQDTLFDILLKVSELRMDIETAEKRIDRLYNAANQKVCAPITFTRQELHQIMIGGEAGYDAAPPYEKEYIDLVCYELNQAIIAKTRTDGKF